MTRCNWRDVWSFGFRPKSRFVLVAFIYLLLAACSDQPRGGQLAYIGSDGNVYVVDAALTDHQQLTDDATARAEGSGRSYHRLAWSPDGRFAFASVSRSGTADGSSLFLVESPDAPKNEIASSETNFYIYVSWPINYCLQQPVCNRLAYLIEEPDESIGLHLIDVGRETVGERTVGFGWPFYFSWSADAEQMLWHRNGGRIDERAASYSQFGVESEQTTDLEVLPGRQIAPAWSPVGDAYLLVSAENRLTLYDGDEERIIATGSNGDISFVWSPDGKSVAWAVRDKAENASYGRIHVYDLNSAESTAVTGIGLNPMAFFWSPDGKRLGYLQWMPIGDDGGWMQWRTVTPETREDRGFGTFNPTPQFRFIAASFNQYAQSHQLWSPDSRYLVYTERGTGFEDRIWLVDTTADETAPILVAEGSLAFWSWR